MTNLYDITSSLAVIEHEIQDAQGELTTELEQRLDATELEFTAKLENIGKWTLNLSADEDSLDKEIVRLQAKKRGRIALRERLKAWIKLNMERVERDKVEFSGFNISIRRNPPSLKITDEKGLPARFLTIIPAHATPNNVAIKDALKSGERIEGAELTVSTRVDIK